VVLLNERPQGDTYSPLSNMALVQCLRSLRGYASVHGYRASFSTWASETTAEHQVRLWSIAGPHAWGRSGGGLSASDYLGKRRRLKND